MTKYYDITGAERADGTPYPRAGAEMKMTFVSEWSLRDLRKAFAKDGVTLHAKYTKSVPEHPLWRRDETGQLVRVPDNEEVPLG